MKRSYKITQFKASANAEILFQITGSNLFELQQEAHQMKVRLEKRGHTLIGALYVEKEIIPRTLENLAKLGTPKKARKARRLLASGKYTGKEELNIVSGRWEIPQ